MPEVVVPQGARIEDRSAQSLRLQNRYGVTLLGVSRQGKRFRDRVRGLTISAGDILLLYGPTDRLLRCYCWLLREERIQQPNSEQTLFEEERILG